MSFSAYLKKYAIGLILLIALVMGVNFILDPLQFYRKATMYEPQFTNNARFQMPGIIRNWKYDTIFVGSSMSHNFVESHVNETLDVNALNATISGSSTYEQYLSANLALETGQVETMFWELNFDSFYGDIERVRADYFDFPYHLYDQNPINDVKYLFSYYPLQLFKDTFFANLKDEDIRRNFRTIWKFGRGQPHLEEEFVIEKYDEKLKGTGALKRFPWEYSYETMKANFDRNILSVIKENPDVEFVLYYPPYSIWYHLNMEFKHPDIFSERMKVKHEIYKELVDLPNVRLYDFQDMKEITHTIENYIDLSHYYKVTNEFMLDYMKRENPIQSYEEQKKKIERLEKQVQEQKEYYLSVIK